MGRPLNKKYFGNRNVGTAATTDNGIGGQGVASVTVAGEFSGFTSATTTVTFAAPTLPGGVTATGTATIVAGAVTAIVMTNSGSGYTTVPAVTVADSDVGAEVTTGTLTAVLTTDTGAVGSATNQENAISMTAFLTGGSAVAVDIIKQVSTRRYKVTDGTRTGIVKLSETVADAAGEGSILATDAASGTYFVTKLTAHKAILKRGTGTVYTDGAAVPWTFGTATATVCKIANA
jgi:hypothetical protein